MLAFQKMGPKNAVQIDGRIREHYYRHRVI